MKIKKFSFISTYIQITYMYIQAANQDTTGPALPTFKSFLSAVPYEPKCGLNRNVILLVVYPLIRKKLSPYAPDGWSSPASYKAIKRGPQHIENHSATKMKATNLGQPANHYGWYFFVLIRMTARG